MVKISGALVFLVALLATFWLVRGWISRRHL
jgi:hypothetical protein